MKAKVAIAEDYRLINASAFEKGYFLARASSRVTPGVSMKSELGPIASKVYRELVRKAPGRKGWRKVDVSKSRVDRLTFRACLGVLSRKGYYEKIDGVNWGRVYVA
jgi:hypothetical protein